MKYRDFWCDFNNTFAIIGELLGRRMACKMPLLKHEHVEPRTIVILKRKLKRLFPWKRSPKLRSKFGSTKVRVPLKHTKTFMACYRRHLQIR